MEVDTHRYIVGSNPPFLQKNYPGSSAFYKIGRYRIDGPAGNHSVSRIRKIDPIKTKNKSTYTITRGPTTYDFKIPRMDHARTAPLPIDRVPRSGSVMRVVATEPGDSLTQPEVGGSYIAGNDPYMAFDPHSPPSDGPFEPDVFSGNQIVGTGHDDPDWFSRRAPPGVDFGMQTESSGSDAATQTDIPRFSKDVKTTADSSILGDIEKMMSNAFANSRRQDPRSKQQMTELADSVNKLNQQVSSMSDYATREQLEDIKRQLSGLVTTVPQQTQQIQTGLTSIQSGIDAQNQRLDQIIINEQRLMQTFSDVIQSARELLRRGVSRNDIRNYVINNTNITQTDIRQVTNITNNQQLITTNTTNNNMLAMFNSPAEPSLVRRIQDGIIGLITGPEVDDASPSSSTAVPTRMSADREISGQRQARRRNSNELPVSRGTRSNLRNFL